MAATTPSAPKIGQQTPSAPDSDPINRKDQLIEYQPSSRMPSNRTEPNRNPSISLIEPTESGQNRPIRTIDHPGQCSDFPLDSQMLHTHMKPMLEAPRLGRPD